MSLETRNKKRPSTRLSHIDEQGKAQMVDVSSKPVTQRQARARAVVRMQPQTLRLIQEGAIAKGEVFAVARIAAILAAKRTHELIPLCHPLPIQVVQVELRATAADTLLVEALVKVSGKTGVEMEALTAASVAALTVYDMCKAVDRGMVITEVRLLEKQGGRSGHYVSTESKASA